MLQPVPSVLVVGAGAVGQVLAAGCKRSGARVELLVRPSQRDDAAQTKTLTTLRSRRSSTRETWRADAVHVDTSSIGSIGSIGSVGSIGSSGGAFDVVIVTVPSSALSSAWLRPLSLAVGPSPVVALQPDVADHAAYVDAGFTPEQIVGGQTAFVAFVDGAGVSWWAPPGTALTLGGPSSLRVQALWRRLRQTGLRVRVSERLPLLVAATTALVTAWTAALAQVGFAFANLRGGALQQASAAAREALRVVAAEHGPTALPFALPFSLATSSTLARAALWLGPRAVPFPLERYVATHFTKVAEQQRLLLARLLSTADRHRIEVPALRALSTASTLSIPSTPSASSTSSTSSTLPRSTP